MTARRGSRITALPSNRRHDVRVCFDPTLLPVAWDRATTGTTFTVHTRESYVTWDGDARPTLVATAVLRIL